ncbi:MAG: lipopolysaccharide biosynthesis protein RfbH [Eubacterium sp.]|nr:lipopolysaccharide biosynthesis protein RfbH [Eubacterium sp.]
MLEGLNEKEAREKILAAVKEYYESYLVAPEYKEGDRISYAARVFDDKEVTNLVDASLDFWLTSGRYCDGFEKKLGEYLGVKYVSLVNSGSSANLLAFFALTSPLLKERRIKKGDEVITVAAGFPTTVAPIIQYGAVPVFVDITVPEYNIDVSRLDEALSEKTKAVMLAHTLGNPFNVKAVKEFCEKNGLWLIEDNCDSLGSEYTLDGITAFTGSFGDIGTSSFYPPHHITMGEGGAVYTNNALLNKIIRSMRDWGRDCSCPSGTDNLCGRRFDGQYGELPFGYDHKYVYSHFGFNLKATEMQAAIGCAQLDKLGGFVEKRRKNFRRLYELLSPVSDKLILPRATENSIPSWFGFLITCKDSETKNRIVKSCEEKGIQTRMLFAGNIIKQPVFDALRNKDGAYRAIGDLATTDRVMSSSFWIGVYPGMTEEKLVFMADAVKQAVKESE